MASPLLLDTDVLIDYLRGQVDAVAFLRKTRRRLCVSALTIAELHVGVREGAERQVLDNFLGLMEVLVVSPEIAKLGGLWRRDYGKSHGTGLIDALIAASAEIHGCALATLNEKHYPMLEAVQVPYRKA